MHTGFFGTLWVSSGIVELPDKESQDRKSNGYLMSERRYGKFTRKVSLPVEVALERIEAVFKRGGMQIGMNKDQGAAPRTRKISISGGKD